MEPIEEGSLPAPTVDSITTDDLDKLFVHLTGTYMTFNEYGKRKRETGMGYIKRKYNISNTYCSTCQLLINGKNDHTKCGDAYDPMERLNLKLIDEKLKLKNVRRTCTPCCKKCKKPIKGNDHKICRQPLRNSK